MKKWEDMTKEEFPRLRDQIIDTAISALKSKYGDDSTGWWKKGVPEEVRIEIAQRKEEDVEECEHKRFYDGKPVFVLAVELCFIKRLSHFVF